MATATVVEYASAGYLGGAAIVQAPKLPELKAAAHNFATPLTLRADTTLVYVVAAAEMSISAIAAISDGNIGVPLAADQGQFFHVAGGTVLHGTTT